MDKRKFIIEFGASNNHSIDYLLGIIYDARITTIERVNKLSIEELHWQYKDGWNTISVLLSHIISVENYFRIEFIEKRSVTAQEEIQWIPGLEMGKYIPQLITNKSIDWYLEELKKSRTLLLESLKNISYESFSKRIEGYDNETGCNLAWVLYHMAEDEVHHRGQISILRKLYLDKQ